MDINDDGYADLISGDYWGRHTESGESLGLTGRVERPMSLYGDIHIFYGMPGGKFKAKEPLRNRKGVPVMKTFFDLPEHNEDNPPQATQPHMVDWDLDGDFDVLIGSNEGNVVLVKNLGNAKNMAFSEELIKIEAGGEVFRVGKQTSPFMADMDNDGKRDLVVSEYDGHIHLLKNIGRDDAPEFAAPEKIIDRPKRLSKITAYRRDAPLSRTPGIGARIFVIDYNGDGKMDILQGDSSSRRVHKEGLSAPEIKELEKAIAAFNEFETECREKFGDNDWRNKAKELPEAEAKKIFVRQRELLGPVDQKIEFRKYGFVWLYLGQ